MRFYVGTYTRLGGAGIAVCEETDGALALLSTCRPLEDPIYVLPSADGRFLYATGHTAENADGMLLTCAVEGEHLRPLAMQPTGGADVCHLTISADGRFLYAANYATGSVAVFPLTDGVAGARIQLAERHGSGPNKARQECAHPHQCTFRPTTQELFVCDLGMDRVAIYEQDAASGLLTPKTELATPAGMGPRHLVFDGTNRLYLVGELDSRVRRYDLDGGVWRMVQELSTLPEDAIGSNYPAAIRLHDRQLFVSIRGHDSLCRIALLPDGTMADRTWQLSGVSYPRDFRLTKSGRVLIANQNGGVVCGEQHLPLDGAVCIGV